MVRRVAFNLPSSSAYSVSFTFFCSLIEAVYCDRIESTMKGVISETIHSDYSCLLILRGEDSSLGFE